MKTWAEMTERERDVLVAQALGWREIRHSVDWVGEFAQGIPPKDVEVFEIPHFSTDRAAAMGLLDGFEDWILTKAQGYGFICCLPVDITKGRFDGVTYEYPEDNFSGYKAFFKEYGAAEAEAICLAFIRAKGINIE